MASQFTPIRFETFVDMATHLDRWAARALVSPETWQAAVVGSHDWLEFAPRNQALLISYGIVGPAAGAETWRLVPSEDGRGCAVRAGEHGFPVRVPITTSGVEPDPFVGGNRRTRAQVERWEWRPVFGVDQLARRPSPGALAPPGTPEVFTGPDGAAAFAQAVHRVATATVRGRLARNGDPHRVLSDAAARLRRSSDRPELIPVLRQQSAWLVAHRVGFAPTESPPSFDPTQIRPRERWERLVDVLDPARRLTASLGAAIGVDLVRSSIPRMEIVDDRVVPAGRRHRLPPATLDALPVGSWVTVGPYTPDEWATRGELGAGRGAILRLNQSAYVTAVENGTGVAWRLEDVAARTGHGHLATGDSHDLDSARRDVAAALAGRYPTLTESAIDRAPRPTSGGVMSLDRAVADLADSPSYSRERLAELIGPKLAEPDRARLADADHRDLARIVGSAGVTAASTVAVLAADGCPLQVAAQLLPMLGVPMASAIRSLDARWHVPLIEAARLVSATGAEMREAGCSAAEILALRPESILHRLPSDPHLWELAAGTMATNGTDPTIVVSHLVAHAPTPEAFSAGLTAAVDDPATGLGLAAKFRAQPEHLAAASERYGLSPAATATILRDQQLPTSQALATIGFRCDFDDNAVFEAWAGASIDPAPVLDATAPTNVRTIGGTAIGTAEELLALLPPVVQPPAQLDIPSLVLEVAKQ